MTAPVLFGVAMVEDSNKLQLEEISRSTRSLRVIVTAIKDVSYWPTFLIHSPLERSNNRCREEIEGMTFSNAFDDEREMW